MAKATAAHPASVIDTEAAAKVFTLSITGQGSHWDALMCELHPKMASVGDETAWYVIDRCAEMGLCDEDTDPASEEGQKALEEWSRQRSPVCKALKEAIPITDGHIKAHRIIISKPDDLNPKLGLFWSHDIDNWPDPATPWGKKDAGPALLIEAMIPVEAVDWQTSCLAHMCWMVGDTESELRIKPDFPLKEVKAEMLENGNHVKIPDHQWMT